MPMMADLVRKSARRASWVGLRGGRLAIVSTVGLAAVSAVVIVAFLPQPDAGIEERVEQIDDQIDHHVSRRRSPA